MESYESIVQLIDKNREFVNFADFGDGASDFWINKAQERLTVDFAPSYVWWLKNYGGGEILGEEIFSVYEMDFDQVIGGDVVYVNELNRRNKITDPTQLLIQVTDRAEFFYFDLHHADNNGEYPVCRMFAGEHTKYADDFLEFLSKRIQDKY